MVRNRFLIAFVFLFVVVAVIVSAYMNGYIKETEKIDVLSPLFFSASYNYEEGDVVLDNRYALIPSGEKLVLYDGNTGYTKEISIPGIQWSQLKFFSNMQILPLSNDEGWFIDVLIDRSDDDTLPSEVMAIVDKSGKVKWYRVIKHGVVNPTCWLCGYSDSAVNPFSVDGFLSPSIMMYMNAVYGHVTDVFESADKIVSIFVDNLSYVSGGDTVRFIGKDGSISTLKLDNTKRIFSGSTDVSFADTTIESLCNYLKVKGCKDRILRTFYLRGAYTNGKVFLFSPVGYGVAEDGKLVSYVFWKDIWDRVDDAYKLDVREMMDDTKVYLGAMGMSYTPIMYPIYAKGMDDSFVVVLRGVKSARYLVLKFDAINQRFVFAKTLFIPDVYVRSVWVSDNKVYLSAGGGYNPAYPAVSPDMVSGVYEVDMNRGTIKKISPKVSDMSNTGGDVTKTLNSYKNNEKNLVLGLMDGGRAAIEGHCVLAPLNPGYLAKVCGGKVEKLMLLSLGKLGPVYKPMWGDHGVLHTQGLIPTVSVIGRVGDKVIVRFVYAMKVEDIVKITNDPQMTKGEVGAMEGARYRTMLYGIYEVNR